VESCPVSSISQQADFSVTYSTLSVRSNYTTVNYTFSEKVGTKNIILRLYNDTERYETNLKNYNNGNST